MNRLIVINPDTCQDPQPEGQEYGYCIFEELPNVSTIKKVSSKVDVTLNEKMVSLAGLGADLQLGVTCKQLCQLQQEDPFCKRIMSLLKSSELQTNNPYYMEDELLMRNITDNKQFFYIIVLPHVLMTQILRAAHDELGHNGSTGTYMLVHRLYYWKGLKASVNKQLNSVLCVRRHTYKW